MYAIEWRNDFSSCCFNEGGGGGVLNLVTLTPLKINISGTLNFLEICFQCFGDKSISY